MYFLLCAILSEIIPFLLLLYFSNKYNSNSFCFYTYCIWAIIWLILIGIIQWPFAKLIVNFIFLLLYNILQSKNTFKQSVLISVLLLSVLYWANGFVMIVGHYIAKEIGIKFIEILHFLDLFLALCVLVLLTLFLLKIFKLFQCKIQYIHNKILIILTCFFLFIVISEQIITTNIYGNEIVWDYSQGLVYPQIDTTSILIFQLLAGITLVSILILFQQLEDKMYIEHENRLLEHQTHEQAIYMQEIQIREKQFCTIQHDIKNHLLILHELLKNKKFSEATSYLSDLEELSSNINFPVNTGNAIVDILLKSKLSVAHKNGAKVQCSLKIPKLCKIKDIEWCIILGNAVDNATQAIEAIKVDKPYIYINSIQKGNFLYLQIQNTCSENQSYIDEGVGLSNIRSVIKRYDGKLDIEVGNGIFTLNILLIISQQ